jgi:hypothetical protein
LIPDGRVSVIRHGLSTAGAETSFGCYRVWRGRQLPWGRMFNFPNLPVALSHAAGVTSPMTRKISRRAAPRRAAEDIWLQRLSPLHMRGQRSQLRQGTIEVAQVGDLPRVHERTVTSSDLAGQQAAASQARQWGDVARPGLQMFDDAGAFFSYFDGARHSSCHWAS